MELIEMANGLATMKKENEYFSKVRGNINWVIRTKNYVSENTGKHYKIACVGRKGVMESRGLTGALIRHIVEYNIRWYNFTYKKDFSKMLNLLEIDGYEIRWI